MRVLVVGGGGREHALAWRLAQNATIDRLYAAPGNAGIAREAQCVDIAADDVPGLLALIEREQIDLTVVGPEAPLVLGLVDELEAIGAPVFGPTSDAARIEGSKAWTKDLCERYGIPAARSRSFSDPDEAIAYLDAVGSPYVVKVDGLAAGKGVTVTEDRAEAMLAIREALVDRVFGAAGDTVVIEEFLDGYEVSAFAVTDGREILPLDLAQDFKRAGDGDTGPNTGGMGAFSPLPDVPDDVRARIFDEIVAWGVRAMEAEGVRFRGVLYAGCIVTADGPKLVEFNCRMGDPETQVVVPRLRSDLGELILGCIEGNLKNYRARWRPEACVTVVAASGGYPGHYETGVPITGIEQAEEVDGVLVFHAGTIERSGRLLTAGGRVLAVSGLGPTVEDARERAYEALDRISFPGMTYRTDIASVPGPTTGEGNG
ncbi:MAG: phosphoribosylamine--glycine ligase [Actinomycetota bacterium]